MTAQGQERNGAPEEIRTPDPQIRSLDACFEIKEENCKLRLIRVKGGQWVSSPSANRKSHAREGPPGQKRSPASPASENGANRVRCSKRKSTLAKQSAASLQSLSSAAAATLYDAICVAETGAELDNLSRLAWCGLRDGAISDDDVHRLLQYIHLRRPLRHPALSAKPAVSRFAGRLSSRCSPRQRQRSPDRKRSRDRRRMLGGSSALPDNLRHHYTEGQRAVLCIIAGEVKRCGVCDFPIDKIAALAGVCRTTVQTALHEARRLLHVKITERPQLGRKNLPNLIEIIALEWRTWIRRGPSATRRIGSNSVKMVDPTKSTDLRKRATEEGKRAGRPPSVDPRPLDEPARG
jgi:hypothetical protein